MFAATLASRHAKPTHLHVDDLSGYNAMAEAHPTVQAAEAHVRALSPLLHAELSEAADILSEVNRSPAMLVYLWLHGTGFDRCVAMLFGPSRLGGQAGWQMFPRRANVTRRQQLHAHIELISKATPDAKTVEIAKLLAATRRMLKKPHSFRPIFITENLAMLSVLSEGNSVLYAKALNELLSGAERYGAGMKHVALTTSVELLRGA